MALYVVCHPRFAEADRRWIETIRRRHDPQAGLIAAHVTLVFEPPGMAWEAAAARMREVAGRTRRFDVGFGAVAARQGSVDGAFYAYLLPERGGEALAELRRQLYLALLGGDPGFPFEPHVTLGRAEEAAAIEALVAELRGEQPAAEAAIDSLHLIMPEQDRVAELARAALAA
jgi:2'-5' RNA ligase